MKKVLIVMAIIFGVGAILAAIGGIVYAANKDKYTEKNFEAQTIEEDREVVSLELDIAYGMPTLYPSTDGKLKIEYFEGDRTGYEYAYANGKAKFEQKSKKKLSMFGKIGNSDYYKIAIYIPASLSEELEIELASGTFKSECEEINVRKLELDVASGSISLGAINATEKIKADIASGEVKIASATTAEFDIDIASGSMTFGDVTADKAKVHVASGKIVFDGLDADEVEAELSTGEIVLSMKGRLGEYRIKGTASTGSIEVKNGGSTVVSGKSINYGSGAKNVDIELSTGKVVVAFEE